MKTTTAKLTRSIDRMDRAAVRFYESKASTILILLLAGFDMLILYRILHP